MYQEDRLNCVASCSANSASFSGSSTISNAVSPPTAKKENKKTEKISQTKFEEAMTHFWIFSFNTSYIPLITKSPNEAKYVAKFNDKIFRERRNVSDWNEDFCEWENRLKITIAKDRNDDTWNTHIHKSKDVPYITTTTRVTYLLLPFFFFHKTMPYAYITSKNFYLWAPLTYWSSLISYKLNNLHLRPDYSATKHLGCDSNLTRIKPTRPACSSSIKWTPSSRHNKW